jgi:hypothetical protein
MRTLGCHCFVAEQATQEESGLFQGAVSVSIAGGPSIIGRAFFYPGTYHLADSDQRDPSDDDLTPAFESFLSIECAWTETFSRTLVAGF